MPFERLLIRLLTPACCLLVAACGGDATGPGRSGPWLQVSAGDQFTCALTRDNHAYRWGVAGFGQLGNDSTLNQPRPVPVAGGHLFRTLSVGSDHACAVALDGATWCWGLNDFLELGATTSYCNKGLQFVDCARAPVLAASVPALDSVVVGGYASCGVTPGGDTHCWGWSDHGQKGSGAVGDVSGTAAQVTGALKFSTVSLDLYHACGVLTNAAMSCWGSNVYGQLATSIAQTPVCGVAPGFPCAPIPVAAASGLAAVAVSTGGTHTCAIASDHALWCWGSNQYGALGAPSSLGGASPALVAGGIAWSRVDAGDDHTCGLDAQGVAYCWGVNTYGQLGLATVTEACPAFGSVELCRTSPAAVEIPLRFASISAGAGHTCAVTAEGALWCWGRGSLGQLGDGRAVSSAAPVEVILP